MISEDQKDVPEEERTAPAPDVPVVDENILRPQPGSDSGSDGTVNDATQKMAEDIESGRTPYNYGAPGGQDGDSSASSVGIVALTVALVIVAVAASFGWSKFQDVSGQLEEMTARVSELSTQALVQKEKDRQTSRAIVRMELKKTLNALERTIALGDARITARALELRDEVSKALASMEAGRAIEPVLGKSVESKSEGASSIVKPPVAVVEPDVLNPEPAQAIDANSETSSSTTQKTDDPSQRKSPIVEQNSTSSQ